MFMLFTFTVLLKIKAFLQRCKTLAIDSTKHEGKYKVLAD